MHKKYVNMPCKWVSLSLHRGPVGESGGDSLHGTFWIEKDIIPELLFWAQKILRF
jgi:hypothetical protein